MTRGGALGWALALGLATAAGGAALALTPRRPRAAALRGRDDDEPLVSNPEHVARVVEKELPDVVRRARKAGARGPLEYVGAGMTAIVLCDARRGWKVARRAHPSLRATLEDEAEWFEAAGRVRAVRPNVAKVYRFHRGPIAIERECVRGRAGRWSDERKLHDLHREIEKAMIPHGWTAPEFKGDSYIFRRKGEPDAYGDYKDGTPVLIDASMASRVGHKLVEYVDGVLDGRRKLIHGDSLRDLGFYVRRERDITISAAEVTRLMARLKARTGQED